MNNYAPIKQTSLVAQMVKCLPTMLETWVRSLGQEDALEKEMATHSSLLAWRIPWIGEPGWGATVHGVTKSRTRLNDFTYNKTNNLEDMEPLTYGWRE